MRLGIDNFIPVTLGAAFVISLAAVPSQPGPVTLQSATDPNDARQRLGIVSTNLSFPWDANPPKTVLSVTSFGARGDAIRTLANTTSNSTLVTVVPSNSFSAADIGKRVILFGVGTSHYGTNHQDHIAFIQAVARGTNLTLNRPASKTATQVDTVIGTDCTRAFQEAVSEASRIHARVAVPKGTYLLMPTNILSYVAHNGYEVLPAISASRGGWEMVGDDPTTTVLLGNGAWVMCGNHVQRGAIIGLLSGGSSEAPITFKNLTFDGMVAQGRLMSNSPSGFPPEGWPASKIDGWGWDVTHDAIIDMEVGVLRPLPPANVRLVNCRIQHFRGEALKSTASGPGFKELCECEFYDNNASCYNFDGDFLIENCLFADSRMAMELYQRDDLRLSVFRHSTITNCFGGLMLGGSDTNNQTGILCVESNRFAGCGNTMGILLAAAKRCVIQGNTFSDWTLGIVNGSAGYQGTDHNRAWVVSDNIFSNCFIALSLNGSGRNRLDDAYIGHNLAATTNRSASFIQGYGWFTNVVLKENVFSNGVSWDFRSATGALPFDDGSNQWRPRPHNDVVGITNTIDYREGSFHTAWVARSVTNSFWQIWAPPASNRDKLPTGTRMTVLAQGENPIAFTASDSVSLLNTPRVLSKGDVLRLQWSGSAWQEMP